MDTQPAPGPAPTDPPPIEPGRRDRVSLGASGEDLAVDHLRARGYVLLARNWRLSAGGIRGELDIVCRAPDGALVIVEVKTRRGRSHGGALAAVTPAKQAKIRALALAFVQQTRLPARTIRFDVIGIQVGPRDATVTHVERAF